MPVLEARGMPSEISSLEGKDFCRIRWSKKQSRARDRSI